MDWYQLWSEVRAPLERVWWFLPWIVLSFAAYGAELLIDRWGLKLLSRHLPRTAATLGKAVDGLWSSLLAAAWAAGTTGQAELAVGGLLVGAAIPVLLRFRVEARERPRGGSLLLLLALSPCAMIYSGCLPDAPAVDAAVIEAKRNACHVDANVLAEKRWAKACQGLEWKDCPHAETFARALERDLESCDKEAYPDGS